MTRIIYGYLRESNDDGMDEAGQRRDIVTLAERYGYPTEEVVFVSDFGQSGRKVDRKGYVRIKDAIAADEAGAVLARSVDRLGRDAIEVMAFEALCNLHGTRVLTDRDGERTGNPDEVNTIVRWLPALLAEEESRLGRDRAKRARVTRGINREQHRLTCEAGDRCPDPLHWDGVQPYGTLPGEDLQAVLDAFVTAKGYSGAVRLLNDAGVKPRRGEAWESTSVGRIVNRHKADLSVKLPKRKHRGSRTLATHIFARLLQCPHDGSLMTATNRKDRSGPAVGYFCRMGRQAAIRCPKHQTLVVRRTDWTWQCSSGKGHILDRYAVTSDHPRPWSVGEHVILEWAKDSTATLGAALKATLSREEPNARALSEAEERKSRLGRAFIDGTIREEDYESALHDVNESIAELAAVTKVTRMFVTGKPLWRQPADEVNERLRDLWAYVVLGPDLRPTGAVWKEQPVLGQDEYGSGIPNPAAVRYDVGWYLPNSEVLTREEVEAQLAEVAPDEPALRLVVGGVAT